MSHDVPTDGPTRAGRPPGAGVAVVLLVLLTGLATVVAVAGAATPSRAAPEDGDIRVEVTSLPEVVTPGQPLAVSGAVRNDATTPAGNVVVDLRVRLATPGSREAADSWLDPAAAYVTQTLEVQRVAESLAPGQSVPFTFTVSPDDVPFPATAASWGPRGLEATAGATLDGVRVTDGTRTFVVWYPGSTARPTAVSVVLPLAPTAQEWTAGVDDVGAAEAAAPRVSRVVASSADAPEVAWAVDPVLLDVPAASDTGDAAGDATTGADEPGEGPDATPDAVPDPAATEPGTAPSPAEQDVTAGLAAAVAEEISRGAVGREVIGLAYADADVPALVDDGRTDLLTDARAAAASIFATAGVDLLPGTSWPVAAGVGPGTLAALAAAGTETVLLPEDRVPPVTPPTYTPTGRGELPVGDATLAGLLWDGPLSDALDGAAPEGGVEELSPEARSLLARQYLLAMTAMVGLERPSDTRHLLVRLGREAAGTPDGLDDRLAALGSAPWVELQPLSSLLAQPAPDLAREPLGPPKAPDTGVTAEDAERIARARDHLADVARIATDPDALVRAPDLALLGGTSSAWRTDPDGRTAYVAQTQRAIGDLESSVGVVPTGTVNFIASSGALPVTVRNELDQAIVARLRLVPGDPAIQVEGTVPVEAPANSEQPVEVPISAVGSADVRLVAELTDDAGNAVGSAAVLTVRVRADWENVGTAVAGAVVGIGFVVGLVRSIRRGRRRQSVAASTGGDSR